MNLSCRKHVYNTHVLKTEAHATPLSFRQKTIVSLYIISFGLG